MTAPAVPGPRRARLRNRIIVRVGMLVAGLSIALGATTYVVVRDVLVDERDRSAVEQFSTNAVIIAAALRSEDIDELELLASLRPEVRARELLFTDGQWFTASLQVQPDDLPGPLVRTVRAGEPASQRFSVDGRLVMAIGAALDDESAYFEVFSFDDLRTTLSTLRNVLVAVGAVATAGGMLVAAWIGRRIAAPLEAVSVAAAEIGGGDLRTRLTDTDADEEVARIVESFNRMADSLEARIERETRFAADVSHELRSPLTTLVNTVSVLERRRDQLSPESAEALTLLAGDVQRFERMVSDLIEISKHDAGSIQLDLTEADIRTVLESTLRRIGFTDVPVEMDPDVAAVHVTLDRQRFAVVLRNVLQNAAAYADGATRIGVSAGADAVTIEVDDRGPGVAPEERSRVFDRFARGMQGERRTTADGSGLGLSLAHENIHAMGGSISVETPPDGVGARFVIVVPRARP